MRAALDPQALTYPLDYMDRGCLAATSVEHGSNNTPTWEFGVRGRIEAEHCRSALRGLFQRYPSCTSTVRRLGRSDTSLHYVVDREYDLERLFRVADLRADPPGALAVLRAEIRNRTLDPREGYPFHLTLARVSEDHCRLFFKQHHALADGPAFIGLLQDFGRFLEHAATGSALPPELREAQPRRSEREALAIGRGHALRWTLAGLRTWIAEWAGLGRRPLTRLFENGAGGREFRGSNDTVHLSLDAALLDHWKPLCERHRISMSALIAGAWFLASRRWNLQLGVVPGWTRLTLIANTRPRDGQFRSFANHLSAFLATLPLQQELAPLQMMRSVDEQVRRQMRGQEHKKRLLFERAITRGLQLEVMRKAIFESAQLGANLNLSNLIPLPFPTLAGKTWVAEELQITTPLIPPFGVMVSVSHYNGRLGFNFNHKESLVPRAQAEDLTRHFEQALRDMAQDLERSAPEAAC